MSSKLGLTAILRRTKKLIQTGRNFRQFFLENGTDMYENELPFIKNKNTPRETKTNIAIKTNQKNQTEGNIILRTIQNKLFDESRSLALRYVMHRGRFDNFSVGSLEMLYRKQKQKQFNTSMERFNNDIFNNQSYTHLVYDESQIFNKKQKIRNLINSKIEYFSENKNHNFVDIFTKTINNQHKTFKITLKSIIVKFFDMTNNKQNFEFTLPFALLPLFYYKGIEFFKIILSKIVKFNSSYTKITIETDNILKLLANTIEKKKSNKDTNSKKNLNLTIKPLLKTRKSMGIASPCGSRNSSSRNVNDYNVQVQQKPAEKPIIELNSPRTKKENNENYTYSQYRFSWVTPKNNFIVQVSMPEIVFEETTNNLRIVKKMDYELLFFLYEKNFSAWDFYMINYLFSYKLFRNVIDRLLSKNTIDLSTNKLTNCIINLQREKIHTYSTNQSSITYLYTSDKTYLNQITSFSLIVTIPDFDNQKYKINFDFSQLLKLYQCVPIIQITKIDKALVKFVDMDREKKTFSFNYEKFDSLSNEEWIDYLKAISVFVNEEEPQQIMPSFSLLAVPLIAMNNSPVALNQMITPVLNSLSSFHKNTYEMEYPSAKYRSVDEEGKLKEISYDSLSRIIKDLEKIEIIKWSKVIHEHFNPKLGNKLLSLGSANGFLSVNRKSQQYRSPMMSPRRVAKRATMIKI